MERYVYITSSESDSYFPDNQVCKFKAHLESPILLKGFWKVGLVEFHATQSKTKSKAANEILYVFTNICKESIVNGYEQPLLRRLEKNVRDGWSYIMNPVIYVSVKSSELIEFEVIIKSGDGSIPSFVQSPLHLTLHFKQYPFYTENELL